MNLRESFRVSGVKLKPWIVKGFFKETPFELPKEEKVLFGLKSNVKPNLMEYLFTNKGVYYCTAVKLMPYDSLSFRTTSLTGRIGHTSMLGLLEKVSNQEDKINSLNDFVSKMK